MHQLIILGNGFDLACGLKSSFSQFFLNRTKQTNSLELIPDDQRNVWDLILSEVSEDDPLWCDIESLISAYVFRDGESGSKIASMFSPGAITIMPSQPYVPSTPDNEVYNFVARSLNRRVVSQGELTDYLLLSLKEYERLFAEHLERQVEKSRSYIEQAQRYLAAIRDACLSDSQRAQSSSSILSFNYTSPFGCSNNKLGIESTRNVHGILGETDTIFGIDGKEVGEGDPALPFTKTYRLLSLKPYSDGQLIKLGENGTSYIKIFGHSLAPADYSYFQSIFDTVNLYSGNTTLVFLYKTFPNLPDGRIDEQAIREDLFLRISKLLLEYGRTLDNKDHGKNLMHKLLLEQRLLIECIDKPSMQPTKIYLNRHSV